jgi:adenylate kinase family enzyme
MRIHILGAPGSGVTTLGRALAERLGCAHFDADDYYWFTADALPYRRKRNAEHRRRLLLSDLGRHDAWVLSGSVAGWADDLRAEFDAVLFRWLPAAVRLERIRRRETLRYGADRIAPGGDLHRVFDQFCTWAAQYDQAEAAQRTRRQDERWLTPLACPILFLDVDLPVDALTSLAVEKLSPAAE